MADVLASLPITSNSASDLHMIEAGRFVLVKRQVSLKTKNNIAITFLSHFKHTCLVYRKTPDYGQEVTNKMNSNLV